MQKAADQMRLKQVEAVMKLMSAWKDRADKCVAVWMDRNKRETISVKLEDRLLGGMLSL